jgi:hypothetical protein
VKPIGQELEDIRPRKGSNVLLLKSSPHTFNRCGVGNSSETPFPWVSPTANTLGPVRGPGKYLFDCRLVQKVVTAGLSRYISINFNARWRDKPAATTFHSPAGEFVVKICPDGLPDVCPDHNPFNVASH